MAENKIAKELDVGDGEILFVRRRILAGIDLYEVTSDQIDALVLRSAEANTYLNVLIGSISVLVTSLAAYTALPPTSILWQLTFLGVTLLSGLAGVVSLLFWRRRSSFYLATVERLRCREARREVYRRDRPT